MRKTLSRFRQSALLFCVCANIFGQADLKISAVRGQSNVVNLEWTVRSLVPPPGIPVLPSYKIIASTNLVDWENVGDTIRGAELQNQVVRRDLVLPGAAFRFVKVESILNFSGLNLIGLTLDGGNFERARFTGCDFFGVSLEGANLRRAQIEAADLRFSFLGSADLEEANLMGAIFAQANFTGVNARNANLSFTDFTGADVAGADLRGADLRFASFIPVNSDFVSLHDTQIDDHTRFSPKTEMVWQIVNGKAVGRVFTNEILTLSDLSSADLRKAVFRNVDLRGSSFQNADLSDANLLQADVDFVDWRGAQITNAVLTARAKLFWQVNNEDFSGRDLSTNDLSNGSFVAARLSGAKLVRANFQRSILVQADLKEADLRLANFSNADLTGANLSGADLTGANLRSTDFTLANLRNAKLDNTVQSGTIFRDTIMPNGTVRNPSR